MAEIHTRALSPAGASDLGPVAAAGAEICMSSKSRLEPNTERALGMALMAIIAVIAVAGVLVFQHAH